MDLNIGHAINCQLTEMGIASFKQKERDYSHFHASQWDKCHRQIAYHYYYAMGYIDVDDSSLKNIIDPVTERIFGNGHHVHSRWNQYFQQTGALLGRWKCDKCNALLGEKEKLGILQPKTCGFCVSNTFHYEEVGFLDKETLWGGHVDAILDVDLFRQYQLNFLCKNGETPEKQRKRTQNLEDKYLVVDLKSINPRQFKTLECPFPEHNTQMQIYLYLSGLRYGKFIYEDKWTQNIKEFLVVRDDDLLSVKKEEASWLKFVVTTPDEKGIRKLPKRAYSSRMDKECLRCKFRGHCWKDV